MNPHARPRAARKVVSSPVISTLAKSARSWTTACPGAANLGVSAAYSADFDVRLCADRSLWRADRSMWGEGARGRIAKRLQDDLGRSVFEHRLEMLSVPAPATAQMGVTPEGGVSGPHPWRRPA